MNYDTIQYRLTRTTVKREKENTQVFVLFNRRTPTNKQPKRERRKWNGRSFPLNNHRQWYVLDHRYDHLPCLSSLLLMVGTSDSLLTLRCFPLPRRISLLWLDFLLFHLGLLRSIRVDHPLCWWFSLLHRRLVQLELFDLMNRWYRLNRLSSPSAMNRSSRPAVVVVRLLAIDVSNRSVSVVQSLVRDRRWKMHWAMKHSTSEARLRI